jgi:hypothetical protein
MTKFAGTLWSKDIDSRRKIAGSRLSPALSIKSNLVLVNWRVNSGD